MFGGAVANEILRPTFLLDVTIVQGGTDFSHGQHQLLILSGGLVSLENSRFLILEKPTAALHATTNEVI